MATSGVEGGVTRRRTPVSSVNATAGGTTEQSSTMDPETPQPAAGAGAGAGGAMTAESPSPSMGGGASPTGKPSVRRIERSLEEESEQWKELINAASKRAPSKLAPYLRKAAPVLGYIATAINRAAPFFIKLYATLFKYFNMLPRDLMIAAFGVGLCFFGGVYPAAIAAAEAFRVYGWEKTRKNLNALLEEHRRITKVNHFDNMKDEDNDGIADVDQVDAKELFTRKVQLFLVHAQPEKMNLALGGIWQATLGVIGVLKIEFAKTITLGAVIGDVCRKTIGRLILPSLIALTPSKYKQWCPVLVNWMCKVIGMSLAWIVQRIVSAFHSAIRGGFMATRALLKFGFRRLLGKEFDDKDTYIDEVAGFVLAAIGLYFQLTHGFSVPFLFELVLWPLSIIEWVIEYTVSS